MTTSFNNLFNDTGGNLDGTLIDKAELQALLLGTIAGARTDTGAVNNWAPGLDGNTYIPWNGAADVTISGLAGGVAGQLVTVKNVTAAKVAYFLHQSGLSSAANKFTNVATSAATPIAAGGIIMFQHDGTNWQLVAHEQGAPITYTTTWGNLGTANTPGNVTLAASYIMRGRQVQAHVALTYGSTTTAGNNAWTFTVPLAASDATQFSSAGVASLTHTGALYLAQIGNSSTTVFFLGNLATPAVGFGSTVPFAWAAGDICAVTVEYWIA